MYKHKFQIILISAVFLFVSCASLSKSVVETNSSKPTAAPTAAVEKAETLYKKRENLDNVREALKILDAARDMNNRNYEVEWKFAQMSYFLGNAYDTPEDEAEEVLKKGITAGKISKRMKPDKPEGHFWYGAVLGEQAKRSPVTIGLTSVDDIKESMQKVIEIDPTYQGASAYDALGLLELKTAGLAGGSEEKAVQYLEKALELEKNNSNIRVHLAEAYLAVGKDAKAKAQLEYVLQMKPDEDFKPEYRRSVFDAKKLLKQRF